MTITGDKMNYPDDSEIKVGDTFSLEGEMTGLVLCYFD